MFLGLIGLAEASAYNFYGFSKDGRYTAFAQYDWGGDSGETSFTELFVIDTKQDKVIKRFYKLADQAGEGRVGFLNELQVYQEAEPLLNKLGISEQYKGAVLWGRQPSDAAAMRAKPSYLDVAPLKPKNSVKLNQVPAVQSYRFKYKKQHWNLELKQISYGTKLYDCPTNGSEYPSYTRGFLLALHKTVQKKTAQGRTATKNTNLTLHHDKKRVPKIRACTFHYEPLEIRKRGKTLVVAVVVYSAGGFEARTEQRFMLVTHRN